MYSLGDLYNDFNIRKVPNGDEEAGRYFIAKMLKSCKNIKVCLTRDTEVDIFQMS